MLQIDTLEQILREGLHAEDGVAIVHHVLGNPCRVEYVNEVRRHLYGRIVGVRIRPRGGTPPTTVTLHPRGSGVRFERESRLIHFATLEPRDTISLLVATQGYGAYLPGVFTSGMQTQVAGSGRPEADFLRRFLLVFQTLNFRIESEVTGRDRIVSPVVHDPKFMPWLASWLDFDLDERIPVTRRRIFLRRAVELFRGRGTIQGIEEMIRTLTGLEVNIVERKGPQPLELGNCALSRPEPEDDEVMLPFVTHPGEHLMVSPRFAREEYFTIVLDDREVLLSQYGERLKELLEQVVRLVEREKPAHLNFVICFRDEELTHNGLVLAAGGEITPNSVLGRSCLLG
jgi:phage tail-like protein